MFIRINIVIGLNVVILLFTEVEGSYKSLFSLRVIYLGPVMCWGLFAFKGSEGAEE